MGDYLNGERPSPGRHVSKAAPIYVEKTEIVERKIDADSLSMIVDAVAKAVKDNSPTITGTNSQGQFKNDDFNNTNTLDKLADVMTVQRGKSKSNFEDLGDIKEIDKDKGDVGKTIDFLSEVDD